uniref:RRM domain-containing protein n=1 Tax=Meloidogyne incognita TaxID=6306 RepID=A0A914LEG1_MELIC
MQSQQQKVGMGIPADRSARSIFVGNISYDVNEEEIKKIFSACGQIIGFRLMYDRDTGRPKGFGFCEFTDVQHAEAAIRNFNGYELHGRQLRVDSATGNESEQQQQFQQFQIPVNPPQPVIPIPEENPYGPEPEPGKAPEAIARTVASMPPEKMFELMRSMKETVNNNPQMARQLLIENPQLAYALLQAQVVMRVVDPKVAYSMLHREQAQTLSASSAALQQHSQFPGQQQPPSSQQQFQPQNLPPQFNMPPPPVIAASGGQFHQFPPQNAMGMGTNVLQQQPPTHGGFQSKQQTVQQIQQPQQIQHTQTSPQQQITPQQQQVQSSQDNLDEEQQAQMLVRVLQLTDEQIRMLPPTERAQVIELRNQLRNAGATA